MGEHGSIFIGHDARTYGEEGTGWVDYDPDFECGGPVGTPNHACPFPAVAVQDNHHDSSSSSSLSPPKLKGKKKWKEKSLSDFDSDPDPDPDPNQQYQTIHLSFPSFRDSWCPRTLYNLFTKAQYPERIRVRILQQNNPVLDKDCLETYCSMMMQNDKDQNKQKDEEEEGDEEEEEEENVECKYEEYIQIHRVLAKDAAGPTWARALLSQDIADAAEDGDVRPQDFCLSTDSHMDFVSNWDSQMIHMWNLANNEYGVLSTYVAGLENLNVNVNNAQEVPHLCMVTFTKNVRTHATKCARNLSRPKLTNAIWGAGLSFSKCHAELKVPVDPHTPGVFDGEEFNRAARFFTYGYDIYTPHRVYIVHNYNRGDYLPDDGGNTWRYSTSYETEKKSHERLYTMIDVPGGLTDPKEVLKMKQSKFGLGDRRTIDQLIQFSGIDLKGKKSSVDGKNRCGNVQWVPFQEHPKGVNYIPRFDANEQPLDKPDTTSVWYDVGNAATIMKMQKNASLEEVLMIGGKQLLRNAAVADSFTNHKSEHYQPAQPLPFLVKCIALLLCTCLVSVILHTKGTGDYYKKKKLNKKRTK